MEPLYNVLKNIDFAFSRQSFFKQNTSRNQVRRTEL